jgi:hypothetical protein
MHEPKTRPRAWYWFPVSGDLVRSESGIAPVGGVALSDGQALAVLLRSVIPLPLIVGGSPLAVALTESLCLDLWGGRSWS